jgi:type III pantothenate kinase
MTASASRDLIAIDLGNSRLKAGRFGPAKIACNQLPAPIETLSLNLSSPNPFGPLGAWVAQHAGPRCRWVAASVNDAALSSLAGWLGERGLRNIERIDDPHHLPLKTALPAPDQAGIDRLLNAVAVNVVRAAGQPAIVVDAGSAVTVDAVSADGTFLGGAIFPGLGLQARALAEFTEKLPLLDVTKITANDLPTLPATSTPQAMSAGLFWATVGSIRTVVEQTTANLTGEPLLVLTGGGAVALVSLMGPAALWLPHLTLQGVWQAIRSKLPAGDE